MCTLCGKSRPPLSGPIFGGMQPLTPDPEITVYYFVRGIWNSDRGNPGIKECCIFMYLAVHLLYLAEVETQRLVKPTDYCQVILHLGHTVPWAAHLRPMTASTDLLYT